MQFLRKLDELETRYDELTAALGDPKVLADPPAYQKTARAIPV